MLFRANTLGGAFLAGLCGLGIGCQSTSAKIGALSHAQEPELLAEQAQDQPPATSKVASFFHYSGSDAGKVNNAPEQSQSPSKIAALFHWHGKDNKEVNKAPDQQQFVLRQGSEIQWQAQTAQDQPGQVKSGSGIVGPDGSAEIGPYGTVKLAGMNLTQATTALEKHLAVYLTTPSVQLSTTVPDNGTNRAAQPQRTNGQPTFARPGTTAAGETIVEVTNEPDLQAVTWRPARSGH